MKVDLTEITDKKINIQVSYRELEAIAHNLYNYANYDLHLDLCDCRGTRKALSNNVRKLLQQVYDKLVIDSIQK